MQEEKHRFNDRTETFFHVKSGKKSEIPEEVILYAILDSESFDKSISLRTIVQERFHAGSVFAIDRVGLHRKVEHIASNSKFRKYGIIFNNQAGIKELQFK